MNQKNTPVAKAQRNELEDFFFEDIDGVHYLKSDFADLTSYIKNRELQAAREARIDELLHLRRERNWRKYLEERLAVLEEELGEK